MKCIYCGSEVEPSAVARIGKSLFDAIDSGTKAELTEKEEAIYHLLVCKFCVSEFLLTGS